MVNIGILAYGSLITDPGYEIEEASLKVSSGEILGATIPFNTPFQVEYARKSTGRSGAPTLVPVPDGVSKCVRGSIITLRPEITLSVAKTILYRREINRVGDASRIYDDDKQRNMKNKVILEEIRDHPTIDIVIYASLEPSQDLLKIIQDGDRPNESKAYHLACAARDSITVDTYFRCRDGVRYLADAIRSDIDTLLTEAYRSEILRLANNAPDLEEARVRIARDKRLIGE